MVSPKVACPNCQSESREIFQKWQRTIISKEETWVNYYRCKKCTLVFQDPEIFRVDDDRTIEEYYQGTMTYEQFKSRRLDEFSYTGNTDKFYLNFLYKFVRNKDVKLFDFGCGIGNFLFHAKMDGFHDLDGIEYSKKSVKFAKEVFDFDIKYGNVLATEFKEKYDIITMLQTIEHLTNPKEILQKINSMLNSKGFLMIATPDNECILAKLWKEKWMHINIHHTMLYNANALNYILKSTGGGLN